MVGRAGAPSVGRPYQVLGRTARHRHYASAVTHRPLARRRPAPAHHLLGAVLGALVVVGCGGAGTSPSFDVAAGCPSEGRAAGAYPDLEARIPKAYEGRGPISLDSGRHCDPTSLGSLAAAGSTRSASPAGPGTWVGIGLPPWSYSRHQA